MQSPKVDDRNAPDIAADVRRLLARDLPRMQLDRQGAAAALINVFARFGEIVIDRINRAPNKNFLAFLDLLGISPVPQQAARAPVTFYLAAGRVDQAVVPKGTQVAAEPGKDEQTPVIFETERELVVVSTRLESLFARYGESDQYVDYSSVLPEPEVALASESKVFAPPRPKPQLIPHALYVGLPFLPTLRWLDEMHLRFVLENEGQLDARIVVWEKCHRSPESSSAPLSASPSAAKDKEPPATEPLTPAQDATGSLSKSGDVVFENVQQWPAATIDGLSAHWMSCRLQTPISCQATPKTQTVRETHLPRITALTVVMRSQRNALAPEIAFSNNLKLDLTKDFYPFGEKPKFGDTFYLACDEAFSVPDALVTLKIELTNPASGGTEPAIPRVKPRAVRLRWEFWDGESWVELGTSDLAQPEPARLRIRVLGEQQEASSPSEFADATRAFSETDKEVTFRFTRAPQKVAVNGQQGFWIRVRILAGDYGKEAYLAPGHEKAPTLVPSSLAPPSISRITVSYTFHKEAPAEALLAYNNWQFDKIEQKAPMFRPFAPLPGDDRKPTVYFGFSLPASAETVVTPPGVTRARKAPFPVRSMSIYAGHAPSGPGQTAPSTSAQTSTDWEYWDGSKWTKWTVRDQTLGLRRSGLIRFLAPENFAVEKEFGQERYWLRLRQTDDAFRANLGVVALNTTMATHCVTGTDEILGASNGQPNQRFRTTRAPVLEGQILFVREQTMPSAVESARIINEEGDDAIQRRVAPAGKGDEIWVRWHEVTNFYHSQSRDRHYTLNRANGEVAFGDGTHGMIPPGLAANLRMATYRTGGGVVGNKPPLTIKQLKTAVPYIKNALNWEAADGGADAESEPALLERGPTQIRHGGRAVTAQDFEDLAQRVSPEVSRAMCVPLYDLVADPAMQHRKPGVVSLIVVPQSSETRPFPSSDLLLQVESGLEKSCPSASNLIVLGPDYVAADVEVIIAVVDPDTVNEVKLGVNLAINHFLHPLTGGLDEKGWDFGCVPQKSELFKLVESIDGVHHVVELKLTVAKTKASAGQRDRLLICAGKVEVSAVLQDETNEG